MPVLMSHNVQTQIIKWGVSPRSHLQMPWPMGLTRAILAGVMSSASRRFELPTIVVVGDSVREFCLYHALYWQQGRALWLPSWFMPESDKYPERLMTALREAEEAGKAEHNESLSFVSFTVPNDELETLKQTINKYMSRASIRNAVEPLLKPRIVQPQRMSYRIHTMLASQLHRSLPQRLRQLRPMWLSAARLIQLPLQLLDRTRNGRLRFCCSISADLGD
jgi:hypothetical protein